MFKNVASQKIQLFAFDTTTGAAKTGDSANITAYVSKDHGTVTVLGDTSATEMDSTNAKGVYVFDLTQGETNADELTFTAKSSTSNIAVTPRFVTTVPAKFTTLVIDAAGIVDANAVKVGPSGSGTAQTAGDLTAQLTAIDDYVDTEVAAIKAKTDNLPADPADASDIAAAFSTVNTTLGTIAGYIDTEVAAIKAVTDKLDNTVENTSDGYIFTINALQQAPSGTGASAAAIADEVQTRTIAAVTVVNGLAANVITAAATAADFTTEIQSGLATASSLSSVASDVADNLAYATRTVIRGTVASGGTTTSFTPSSLSPSGVDADQFKGRIIIFDTDTTTAALRGEATDITANTAASLPAFTYSALTTAPQAGDTFSIV